MEGIPRIHASPPDEAHEKLRNIFFGIEHRARHKGNAELLIQLDRIPGLVLGASNRVSEGAEAASLTAGHQALSRILAEAENSAAGEQA